MKIKIEISQIKKRILFFGQYYLVGLFKRISLHNDLLLAGGLAFSLFICIVPMILVVFSVLGHLLAKYSMQTQIESYILTVLPYPDAADYVKEILITRIEEFSTLKTVTGFIGIFGLLFAASGLFTSMRNILNIIFRSDRSIHAVIGKLRDLSMILLVLLFFLISFAILPVFNIVKGLTFKIELFKFFQFKLVNDIIFFLISFLIIFCLFVFIYYFIPHAKLQKKVIFLSAFWSTFFWEIARVIFGFYVIHFSSLNRIYGAYVFIVISAFWIYYSSIIFIVGAEIGQLYKEKIENSDYNKK